MLPKTWLCITSLFIIGWNIPVLSQDLPENIQPFSPHLEADFTTGPGFGYSSSLGSFSGFFPLQQTPGKNLFFLTGRLHFSPKDDLVSSSLILAMRRLQNQGQSQSILGGYVAYDIRNTGIHHFHQLGLGFEHLSDSWDWRLNGYIPLGNTRHLVNENISSQVSYSNPQFERDFLSILRRQQQRIEQDWQSALTGFELETGGKLSNLGREGSLRGYVGVYHYGGEGISNFWGWKSRLEANPSQNYRLGLTLSQDEKFGTNLVLSVGIRWGGINPQKRSSPGSMLARLAEPMARNSLVAVAEQREIRLVESNDRIFATNPQTNQPWRFRHVNLGIGTGNGTAENPTGTLQAALDLAQPHDIVYVRSGNHSPIPGFTIPAGVQVLSTGPKQVIPTLEIAQLQLPESNSEIFPKITGTAMMGNQTTLSGFAISTTTGPGILGSNVQNIIIRDNRISNTSESAISLQNVAQSIAILNNSIRNTELNGIFLVNHAGQVDLSLVGNKIRENGQGLSISFNGNAGGRLNFQNNEILNNHQSGIDIAVNDNNVIAFYLENNQVNSNQLRGLSITMSEESKATFIINDNQFNNNQQDGIHVEVNNLASLDLNLRHNKINDNMIDGIYLQTSDEAKAKITMFNNKIDGNDGIGFDNFAFNESRIAINLQENFLINSVNEDLFGFTFDSGKICLKANGNTINNVSLDDSIGGTIAIEGDIIAQNTISNPILTTTTPVAAGTCGF